jgi:hypothetical protein
LDYGEILLALIPAVVVGAIWRSTLRSDQRQAANSRKEKILANSEGDACVDNIPHCPSADFVALIDAIAAEGRANRTEEKDEDRGARRREITTITLLAITVGLVGWQIYEMIKVYEPIKTQAEAAKASAAAATAQSVSSENALIQAQRAWIGPRAASITAELAIGKPIETTFTYENSGHEPGVDFHPYAEAVRMIVAGDQVAAQTIQQDLGACRDSTDWQGGSVVFPSSGGIGGSAYNYSIKTPSDFVTDAMLKGDEIIAFQGCFVYRTFTQSKHTAFCFYYKQGTSKISSLNICDNGNEAN